MAGFTLIELAVVLVIIGFIVGGVLVGRDLIKAASLRAQITQIERFNTGANTFRAKYGYLPGDIPNPDATTFGFATRGSVAGEGDGDSIIQGNQNGASSGALGYISGMGESPMFWVDLSRAGFIEGSFTTASPNTALASVAQTALDAWFPQAKIGSSNYVYVWSGGLNWPPLQDNNNYFAISAVSGLPDGKILASGVSITVSQASAIDSKIDDGMPFSGKVTAMFLNWGPVTAPIVAPGWCAVPGRNVIDSPATLSTCADNSISATGSPGIAGSPWRYSLEMNGGTGANCALSFQFQ